MVAKLLYFCACAISGLNLAKIHMVAKHYIVRVAPEDSLNLAKIHMVAKRQVSIEFCK